MSRLLVLANDTESGKTWLTCEILKRAVAENFPLAPFKPVATGDRSDALRMAEASGGRVPWTEITPVFYQPPLAPLAAAMIEDSAIDWNLIEQRLDALEKSHLNVLIESAGGVLSPMDKETAMCDLTTLWKCPALLVVPNKLGAITQTRCCIEALHKRGIELLAVVLNEIPQQNNSFPDTAQDATAKAAILEMTRASNIALLREFHPEATFLGSSSGDLDRLWHILKARLTCPASALTP